MGTPGSASSSPNSFQPLAIYLNLPITYLTPADRADDWQNTKRNSFTWLPNCFTQDIIQKQFEYAQMAQDQEKMQNYLSNLKKKNEQQQQQQKQQQQYPPNPNTLSYPIPDEQADSNVYQDDFDDAAIVNVVSHAVGQQPKPPATNPHQRRVASASQQKKPAKTMPIKRPYAFNKLNEAEKEKVFLDIYDENQKLKEQQTKFDKMYQNLEVKLTQMSRFVGAPNVHRVEIATEPQADAQTAKLKLLELENEKLKQKNLALSQAQKIVVGQQKKKKLISSDKADGEFSKGASDNQVKELLKLNDMLKKRCLEQETQFRQMQAMLNSKLVNQQELSQKNAQFVNLQDRCNKLEQHLQVQSKQLEDERKRQSEIMSMLREEKDKNHQLESQIRGMELAQKSVNDLSADLIEARRQKREIEERLAVLMESPFFKEYNERAQIQAKLKTLEQDQIKSQTEMKNLREQNARFETEIRLKKEEIENLKNDIKKLNEDNRDLQIKVAEKEQQLLPFKDLNYWDNDQFLKVLGNLKWTGEDPAWRKIEFIDRTYLDSDDPNVLRKEIEHLKLEKGELAAHLEKTQTLLRNQQDIQYEKDQVHKTQVEQLQLELKAAYAKAQEYANIADLKTQARQQKTLYEAEGVKYDDNVTEFSADNEDLEPGENYFDLYVGKAEFQASELLSSYRHTTQTNLDLNSLLTFVTIDFYDHETQHSGVVEGVHCQYNLQISFKVDANGAFIQYLESDYLKIELYVSQGSEATRVGTGLMQMKELVYQNVHDTYSKVISGHLSIYGTNNQFVGIVEFKARMRFPISNIVRLLKEKNQIQFQEEDENQVIAVRKRRVVICIDKATNLPAKSNTFIYYNFENKDYHTNTQMGQNPKWDFRMVHEVVFNELFVVQLKKAPLEFFLIDDNMPLVEGANDKIGTCMVDLQPLLTNEIIDIAAEVKNDDGERIASLYVKVFWYDVRDDDQQQALQQKSLITQSWEDTITAKIMSEMRSNGLTGITAFRLFTKGKNNVVALEDFAHGIRNVLNIKLNQQELQLYYSKLKQPLNQQNFEECFHLQSVQQMQMARTLDQFQSQPLSDLSQINQMISQNTQQLQFEPQEILKDQINEVFKRKLRQGKTKEDIFREIDSVRPDGLISVEELQNWLMLQRMNVPVPQLRQFLKFYMDVNQDQKIDLREFFNFFLLQGGQQSQIQPTPARAQQEWSQEPPRDPISATIQSILLFAKQNQYTLMQVRQIIDDNRNSYIDRNELRAFLIKFGVQQTVKSEQELEQVMNFFDSNGDGMISIQEFSDALFQENKKAQIIQKQPSFSAIQNYVIGYFITYMKKNDRSIPQLFNDIDSDGNGYLSKAELKQVFRNKILVPIDNDELNQLFAEFDDNRDGKISIQEFLKLMKPQLELAEKQFRTAKTSVVSNENLLRKIEDVCHKNASLLSKAFQASEAKSGLITETNFVAVLTDLKLGLTNSEIIQAVSQLCVKDQGLINYIHFINIGKARGQLQQSEIYGQTAKSGFGSLSQVDQERAVSKARDIFSKISKALKRNTNYKSEDLFKTFDLDGNGQLTQSEMGQVFQKMRIRLDRNDLELVFKAVDRNGNGWVDIHEFLKFIDI